MTGLRLGTRLYGALAVMTEEHRTFVLAREDNRIAGGPRCTGISSDGLTLYAVGLQAEPGLQGYPSDGWDLQACERTYAMAPADLQVRMLPILEKFRAHVGKRQPSAA